MIGYIQNHLKQSFMSPQSVQNNFLAAFNSTQNSYKFYWWLSIMDFIIEDPLKKTLYFDEIIFKIITKIWYPANYFKLSFGNQDQLYKYVLALKKEFDLNDNIKEAELYKFLLEKKSHILIKRITTHFSIYVPYRFIRPWYATQTRRMRDHMVHQTILKNQDKNISAPYIIDPIQKSIILNNETVNWIKANFRLMEAFTTFELSKFLEKRNLNVPNISIKLSKPTSRSLNRAISLWKKFALSNPKTVDVYSIKPLMSISEFSIDHYLPWSFVSHDFLWNTHPVEKKINSSKNNLLPSKQYNTAFAIIQFDFVQFLIQENEVKALEDYYQLFNLGKEQIVKFSKDDFVELFLGIISPKLEIANNMGYQSGWIHLSF